MSFGGAGGLHVCALAAQLGTDSAMVPVHGGVLSALGMLVAQPGRQLSQTRIGPLLGQSAGDIEAGFSALAARGLEALEAEGHEPTACETRCSVDLRYAGQSYTLNLAWKGGAATAEAFHRRHQERYGHRLDLPVELVNLRAWVRAPLSELRLPMLSEGPPAKPCGLVEMAGLDSPVPRYQRAALAPGQRITGPAVISERVATSWVEPNWSLLVDRVGNLLLERA